MARTIDDIERDIERTRNQLASTLDQLAERTKPGRLAGDVRRSATAKLKDPQSQKVLLGVGAVVVAVVALAVTRNRRKNKDIKELQHLLAGRD